MNTEIIEFVKSAPIGALLTNRYGSEYEYSHLVRVEGGLICVSRNRNFQRNRWEDVKPIYALSQELEDSSKMSWANECITRTLKEGSFIKL
jgi:hypothetical protein